MTNVSLYWFTNTGGSSIRFYYEDAHATPHTEPTTIPLGVAGFYGDFSGVRRFAERDHKTSRSGPCIRSLAVTMPRIWSRKS